MRFLQKLKKSLDEGNVKPSEIMKYQLTDEEKQMFFRDLFPVKKEE